MTRSQSFINVNKMPNSYYVKKQFATILEVFDNGVRDNNLTDNVGYKEGKLNALVLDNMLKALDKKLKVWMQI